MSNLKMYFSIFLGDGFYNWVTQQVQVNYFHGNRGRSDCLQFHTL